MKDWLEGLAARLFFWFIGRLPPVVASNFCGWLARTVGPRLGISRRAHRNLARVMPELSAEQRQAIVVGCWDNLGRVAGEFPHLDRLYADGHIEVAGLEHLNGLRDDGQPGIFFSGHLGNWEINGMVAALNGLPLSLFYRAANNPATEMLYRQGRAAASVDLIPKGAAGARRGLKVLDDGGHLGMLVDQKMNDGIAVPFFGIDAMTAPALAQFALKFKCPVVPARVVRLPGVRFRLELFPKMDLPDTGDRHADLRATMVQVNALLESWVREHPDQWLWLHRRWPD